MKYLWFLLTLFPLANFGQSTVLDYSLDNEPCDVLVSIVEDMPQFPGGDVEIVKRMRGFLNGKNCEHLQTAKIIYVVDRNGKPTNLRIDGISDDCTKLFIEEFEKLPNWTPGYQDGKPVCVQYIVNIMVFLPLEK